MRILIAADTYYPNLDGASYFTQRLAQHLVRRGHEVLVIAPGTTRKNTESIHNGVRLHALASWPSLFHHDYRFTLPFFLKRTVRPIIAAFQPDIAHVQGHFFIERAVADVARELGIPVLGTNHFMPENLLHYLPGHAVIQNGIRQLMWYHFKRLFGTLPLITTPTATAAQIIKNIGILGTIVPISCGIDTANFNPSRSDPTLATRYHLPDEPLLLCVNRLAPEKHVDLILCAVERARTQARFHLGIIGKGEERAGLEKLAKELGITDRVTFLGAVSNEDLPFFYARADVFVMAGTAELQSLVTMEAMASGLPVIAANALALPELVKEGENGLLFEPDDTETLSAHIVRLFSDRALRKRMGAKSLQLIKVHDENVIVEKFENLYRSLIAAKNARATTRQRMHA